MGRFLFLQPHSYLYLSEKVEENGYDKNKFNNFFHESSPVVAGIIIAYLHLNNLLWDFTTHEKFFLSNNVRINRAVVSPKAITLLPLGVD